MSADAVKLLVKIGDAVNAICDAASVSPGGDQALFGSTNDLDHLRYLRHEYNDWWFHLDDAERDALEYDPSDEAAP